MGYGLYLERYSEMKLATRINNLEPYLFTRISRIIEAKRKQGIEVISFGIGDPDTPTPTPIVKTLVKEAEKPANHRYPETEGLPEFRTACAKFYQRRFGVTLSPETEVINLIGAKEGIAHASLCFLNEGDTVITPDPSYPVYDAGALLAGANTFKMALKEELAYSPDFTNVPTDVARKAKAVWINYPNNPTGATATLDVFNDAVQFALDFDLLILHDACYSEVTYDGYVAPSILQAEKARQCAMEFHSLSKTMNMTGWRVGMAVGNSEMVGALMKLKSNLDSGSPQAIQQMGITALNLPNSFLEANNAILRQRRDKVVAALNYIGLPTQSPKAGLYVWTRVPAQFTSQEFSEYVLERADIVVTPGTGYGKVGEGHIRLSLTLPDTLLDEGVQRLSKLSFKVQN